MSNIELSQYINALRVEMLKSIDSGRKSDLQFATDKIELELSVGTTVTGDVNSGIKVSFWVVDASLGGKAEAADTTMQTIRLSFVPIYKGKRGDILVSEED